MSPGMVRWGGIAVFVGMAIVIIVPVVMVSMIGARGFQGGSSNFESSLDSIRVLTIVMNIVYTAIIVFVFWTTKGFFNALSYNRANLAIVVLIAVQVLSAIVGSVMNTSAGMTGLMQLGALRGAGIATIVVIVSSLAFIVALLLFALRCLDFGKLGGGLWKAIGILYLIGLVGFIVAVVIIAASAGVTFLAGTGPGGGMAVSAVIAMIIAFIAILCYAAAIICHGIGLIMGASRMERDAAALAPNPA